MLTKTQHYRIMGYYGTTDVAHFIRLRVVIRQGPDRGSGPALFFYLRVFGVTDTDADMIVLRISRETVCCRRPCLSGADLKDCVNLRTFQQWA